MATPSEILVNEYFANKRNLEELEFRNKEILFELQEITGGHPATIGNHKLMEIERKGSVSYARVVKDLLPNADLESYRGQSTTYWTLK